MDDDEWYPWRVIGPVSGSCCCPPPQFRMDIRNWASTLRRLSSVALDSGGLDAREVPADTPKRSTVAPTLIANPLFRFSDQ